MATIYETAIALRAKVAATFKSDFLGAAGQVAKLRAETEKLKAAEKASESYGKVSAELSRARERYSQTAAAVAALAAATKAQGGATKESAKWTAAGERELAKAAKELDRAAQASGRASAALHAAGVSTKNLAGEQKRLELALAATEARTKLAEAVEHHFGETLEKVKKKVHELSTAEGSAAIAREKLKGLGETGKHLLELTVGADAAAFALFEVAKSTAEAAGDIEKMSVRLGMGTEALQLMRYAGQASHVDVEELNTGLGKMAINIGKVIAARKKGGGLSGEVGGIQMLSIPGAKTEKTDPFKHIGLSAEKLAQLKPEEQLAKIAGGIRGLKTHSEQAAAAVAIFGRGGLAMLPLLAQGAEGLEEFYAQARESGNILSDETIENAKKFHHAYLQTQQSILGVKNTLGAALLPVATSTLREVSKWVIENRGQIKIWAKQSADWIENTALPAVKKIVPEIKALALQVGGWIKGGVELIGGVKNLGIALATLRIVPFGASMAALAVNVGRLALQYWAASTAAKALAVQQAALGAGGAAKAAGSSLLGAAGAAGGVAGIGLAVKGALGASSLAGSVAAGGVAITAGLVAAAAGIGVLIGTGIRKVFNTDDALARLFGQAPRADGFDTGAGDADETARLNRLGAVGDRARAKASAAAPVQIAKPRGGGTHHTHLTYAPHVVIQGNASKEDVEAAHKVGLDRLEKQLHDLHRKQARLAHE